jgi:hypothetical protein
MVSAKAIVTLLLFIIFVIVPVHIPLPKLYGRRFRIPINLTTAPIATIAILWAAECIGPGDIRDGIVGTDSIKPYNILILFFSLAYMAIILDITGVLQAAAFWVSNKGGTDGRNLLRLLHLAFVLLVLKMWWREWEERRRKWKERERERKREERWSLSLPEWERELEPRRQKWVGQLDKQLKLPVGLNRWVRALATVHAVG